MTFKDWIKYYRGLGSDGILKKKAQSSRLYNKLKKNRVIDNEGDVIYEGLPHNVERLDKVIAHSLMIEYSIYHYHLILSPAEYNG